MSIATVHGICLGRRTVEPDIGNRPRCTSEIASCAPSPATRMSSGLQDLHAAGVAVALDRGDQWLGDAVGLEEALVDQREVGADAFFELVLRGLARDHGADETVEVGAG